MSQTIKFSLSFNQRRQHLVDVTLTFTTQSDNPIISLPVWSPGSYLVREYSRHLRGLSSNTVDVQQLDKASYQITAAKDQEISLTYQVYANELTVRTSEVNEHHAFIHSPCFFFEVKDQEFDSYELTLDLPKEWTSVSTGLTELVKNKHYQAPTFDDLLDCPLEIGSHKIEQFTVAGKAHYYAAYGAKVPTEHAVVADLEKVFQYVADYVGEVPYEHYTVMSHFLPNIYGGLEHKNSTAVQFCPWMMHSKEGYQNWLSLMSHEYFHTWNIKRIRPEHFSSFDYSQENYTDMLWLAEGLTSFLDDLFIYQAGFTTQQEYLKVLTKAINRFEAIPGRFQDSIEDSSFNAWIKLYRPDENSNNSSVSYYLKGMLLFLILHIDLVKAGSSSKEFVRSLWGNYKNQPDQGISKKGVLSLIEGVANKATADKFATLLSSKEEIDFDSILKEAGLEVQREEQKSLEFGMTVEFKGNQVFVKTVKEGGAASDDGLYAGDEIIALNNTRLLRAEWDKRKDWLRESVEYELLISRQSLIKTVKIQAEVPQPQVKKIVASNKALVEKVFKEESYA